eukprot:Platyproteum_vivax@DN7215_c1_g1_i2.p1
MVVKKFVCLVVFLIWGSEMVAGIQRRHASEPSEGAAAPVPITVEMMGPVTDDDGTYTKPVEQHSGRKKGDKEFPCSICGAVLRHSFSLTRHMKLHRNPPEKQPSYYKPKGDRETKMLKKNDKAKDAKFKRVACPKCQATFHAKYGLNIHMGLHMNPPERRPSYYKPKGDRETKMLTKPYACPECDMRYKTHQNVYIHKKLKHQGKREMLKCPQCPRTFPRHCRYKLKKHIKDAHETEGYEFGCEVCRDKYKTQNALTKHWVKKHPGEPQTRDAVEDMETTGSETRASSGSKIEAPSASAIQESVQLGAKIGKKKPQKVVCPHCNKLLSGRLNRHIATQHSDIQAVPVVKKKQPFPCSYCSDTLSRNSYLNNHIRTKHPEIQAVPVVKKQQPFPCPHCSSSLSRKHHLTRHIKNQHKDIQSGDPDGSDATSSAEGTIGAATPSAPSPTNVHAAETNSDSGDQIVQTVYAWPTPTGQKNEEHEDMGPIDLSLPKSQPRLQHLVKRLEANLSQYKKKDQ